MLYCLRNCYCVVTEVHIFNRITQEINSAHLRLLIHCFVFLSGEMKKKKVSLSDLISQRKLLESHFCHLCEYLWFVKLKIVPYVRDC